MSINHSGDKHLIYTLYELRPSYSQEREQLFKDGMERLLDLIIC